jgi:hypothetical protein
MLEAMYHFEKPMSYNITHTRWLQLKRVMKLNNNKKITTATSWGTPLNMHGLGSSKLVVLLSLCVV